MRLSVLFSSSSFPFSSLSFKTRFIVACLPKPLLFPYRLCLVVPLASNAPLALITRSNRPASWLSNFCFHRLSDRSCHHNNSRPQHPTTDTSLGFTWPREYCLHLAYDCLLTCLTMVYATPTCTSRPKSPYISTSASYSPARMMNISNQREQRLPNVL